MSDRLLTPKELATAIGVSESSLKRWADEGVIQCSRTVGGHRRIPLAEAIRFVRDTKATLVRPGVLGVPEVETVAAELPAVSESAERLERYLIEGRAAEARGLVLAGYLAGRPVADLMDHMIAPAMERIGDLWHHDERGVFLEHRATDICLQAVNHLRGLLPHKPRGPAAVGGAPVGDPYLLPSLASALVLTSEGFAAENLGPETPTDALLHAMDQRSAKLAWLSLSSELEPDSINAYVARLLDGVTARGGRLVLGGRFRSQVTVPAASAASSLVVFGSMTDLAAYARGVINPTDHPGAALSSR